MNEKIQVLYNQLSQDGYDVGDINSFSQKMTQPEKARALYDTISKEYELGEFDSFYSKLDPNFRSPEQPKGKAWFGVEDKRNQQYEKPGEKLGNLSVNLEPLPQVEITPESVYGTKRPEYFNEQRGSQNYAQVANKVISEDPHATTDRSISSLLKEVDQEYTELSKRDKVQSPVKSASIKPYQYLNATDEVAERNLMSARKTLEDAEKILNSPVDKKTGTWFDVAGDRIVSFAKGAGEQLTNEDFWTIGMSAINRNISALNIAKKLEKGEQLRRDEELLLDSFANLQFANMLRADNMSSAYKGGQGTVEMASFIAQLATTGGLGKLATKGAEKALLKVIAEKVGGKLAKHLANTGAKILTRTGAAAIGATIAPAAFEKTTENLLGKASGEFNGIDLKYTGRQDAMTGFDSYIDGWADTAVEFATEMSGGSLGVIGKVIKEVPGIDKVLKGLARTKLGSAGRILGNNPILKQAGVHGFLGEYNEEFDGAVVRDLLGLEDFKESFWNWDAQATLLYTLGPVAGFSAGMNAVQGAKIKNDFKNSSKRFDGLLLKNGYSQQEIEDLKIAMLDASPEMLGQQLRSIVGSMDNGVVEVDGKPTFNEEMYGTALQFAVDASKFNAYTQGLDEKLEEYRTQAKTFIEQNQNPDMGAIVYAEVAGKPVRVTKGNIVFNEDKLDRENSSKEFYYENENGEIIPANIELASKLLEVTPIEQATEVAAQKMTAPLIAKEQNEEVRPYEVGEQVTIDVEGSRVMGQIVDKTENGYKFTDSTGMTIDIEPRQIIDEDNLQGVDNGVLVEYMLNGQPQTGLVEDFYQYRQQGQAIVDGNLVNLSDIIGIAQPGTDSNMLEITPENEGTPVSEDNTLLENGTNAPNNDIPAENQNGDIIPQYPVTKTGELDFDNFTPEQLFTYTRDNHGEEAAIDDLKVSISNIQSEIDKKKKGFDKLDMKGRVKAREAIKKLEEQKSSFEALLPTTIVQAEEQQPIVEAVPEIVEQPANKIRERGKRSWQTLSKAAAEREKTWGEPQNLRELVLRYFSSDGRVSWKDKEGTKGLGAEYRYSENERRKHIGLSANDAPTPEQLAHMIWEANAFEEGNFEELPLYGTDTQEILNEILDVLNSFTKAQMTDEVNRMKRTPQEEVVHSEIVSLGEKIVDNFIEDFINNPEENPFFVGELTPEQKQANDELDRYFNELDSKLGSQGLNSRNEEGGSNENNQASSPQQDNASQEGEQGSINGTSDVRRISGSGQDVRIDNGDIVFYQGNQYEVNGITTDGQFVDLELDGKPAFEDIPVSEVSKTNNIRNGQSNEAGLDNGRAVEDKPERLPLGAAETWSGIYSTVEASNNAGEIRPDYSTEEREELEARGINPYWDNNIFRRTLREQAKQNGVWLDDYIQGRTLIHNQKTSGTSENDIYEGDSEETIIKVNNLAYAKGSEHHHNLSALIDRIEAHNDLFPNVAYTIKGFAENKDGHVSLVLEQPFVVDIAGNATQEEINEELTKLGFKLSTSRPWSNGHKVWTNGEYELFDARPANVLKGNDGNLYFIDTFPHSVRYMNDVSGQIESQSPELNPTEAQKEAGNYKKAHVNVQGFDITIENPKGSIRSGIDENGREWSNTLQNHYGYFKRTEGKDGDQIDVFIGENPESETVFVVDQNNPESGAFDESKVMLGFNTPEEAKAAYMSNYEADWNGFMAITPINIEDFKGWLYDGARQRKPFSEYKDTPAPVESAQKHPWEMTKDEYIELSQRNAVNEEAKQNVALISGFTHITSVFEALLKGIKVPENVLNEYPGIEEQVKINNERLLKIEEGKEQTRQLIKESKETKEAQEKERQLSEERQRFENKINTPLSELIKRSGYKSNRNGTHDLIRYEQLKAIKQALSEGKEVPAEVLADYPELQKVDTSEQKVDTPIDNLNAILSGEKVVPVQSNDKVKETTEKQDKLNDEVEESEAVKELRKEIKDLKSQKAKLTKEMSDRNGLFGDTKSDPNDLFGGGEVDSNAFVSRLDEINNRIKTVNDKIKKQIKAEATGKTEANQQQSINLNEKSYPKQETFEQKKSEMLSETESKNTESQENKKSENEKSFPKEKSKEIKSEQKVEKIEDFGEKIEGARKDEVRKYYNKINLNGMTLSTIFPKPNMQDLLKSGLSVKEASAIKVAYEFALIDKKYIKNKAKQIGGIKFYAAYAKTVLSENLNIEFTDNRYVFTDYGKSQIELRTSAYEAVAKELGSEYLDLDLSKVSIRELTPEYVRRFVNKPDPKDKYEVAYYLSQAKRFETLEEALSEFISQVKANTKTDVVEYKRKINVYSSRQDRNIIYVGYQPKGKELIKLKEGFTSAREAFDYIKANQAELQTELERILQETKQDTKPTVRLKYTNETARERVGKDWRGGENISSEKFATTFGFRGVEFGNWVNQKERQVFMNNAYDSLMDLSQLLGISPAALSLNGRLAVSFGSRGSGGISAHYEPERIIINLTKTKGLGSLAHEWYHAMDNYFAGFGVTSRGMKSATSGQFKDDVRTEMIEALKSVYDSFPWSYKERSRNLDVKRGRDYFKLPTEMAARAFENYILVRLNETGQVNDFLANYVSEEDWNGDATMYPYPKAEEEAVIRQAFDKLFNTIEETESGELREPELQYGKKPITKQEVSDKQSKKAEELLSALKEAGFENFGISRSITDFGVSTYVQGQLGLKFRISDHSVTSTQRIFNEIPFNYDTQVSDLVELAKETKISNDKIAESKEKAHQEYLKREKEAADKWERIKGKFEGKVFKTNKRTYQTLEDFMKPGANGLVRSDIHQKELGIGRLNKPAYAYEWAEPTEYDKWGNPTNMGEKKPSTEYIEAYEEVEKSLPETIIINGVERSTTNSEGKPIHSTEEGIRNFWEWFGESKVVDEQGRPLVVYHGTDKKFNTFDKSKKGITRVLFSEIETQRHAFFFTPSEKIAIEFGFNLIPAYLKSESIVDMDDQSIDNKLIENGVEKKYLSPEFGQTWELFDNEFGENIVPALKKMGYDGITFQETGIENEEASQVYGVFSPNQIKSATSNTGEFSPEDASILNEPELNYQPRYKVSETGFYSTVEKALSAITQEKGTRDQFKAMLLKNGAKQAEMEGMPLFEPQQQFINFTPEEIQDEINKAHGSEENQRNSITKTVEAAISNTLLPDRGSAALREFGNAEQPVEERDKRDNTNSPKGKRTVLEGFKESGYVDFVGTKVSNHQDIADLWSIHRSPYIEKSHVIFIKDGKIAGSMAATSGRINQSMVNTPKEIAEHAKKIGATQVYLLHNHPSGLPNVSIPDVKVTFYTADRLRVEGIDLLGHVVVDHDKYSFIDTTKNWPVDLNDSTLEEWVYSTPQFEYKNKVPKLYSEREVISSKDAPKQMFEVARNILSEPTYKGAIVYLTNHHKKGYIAIAAYDILPEGATKEDAIRIAKKGLDNNLGAMVVFLHDGSLSGTWDNTPKGTVDVINIAERDSDYFFNQSSVNEPELEQLWVREGDVEYNPQRELLDAKLNKAQIKFANITVSPSLLREAYQDRHLPVRKFIEQLRETGLNIENFNDWYKQSTHLPGKIDAQLEAFERQFLTPMLGEIDKLIKQGHSYRDVENYAILKHGIERNEWFLMQEEKKYLEKNPQATKEEISEYLNKQPQDYSGITAVQEEVEMSAEDYIKQFEEKSNTDSFWNAVKQATKYSLDKAYEGQIINKDQYNELTNRYKYYIPLRGFDKETAEDRWDYTPDMGTYYVMPLIKAKGRTSRSETPFAFIWQMAQTSISSANKNLHNLSIKRLAELDNKRYASTGLMSISRAWYERTSENTWELRSPEYSQDRDTYQKNIEEFEDRMTLLAEQGFATQKRGKLNVGLFIKPKQAAQHEVHVMQNGEEFVVYFNGNPRVARAINGANSIHNQPNQVQQAVRQATRMMAANFTTRNPLFVVANFLRDYNYASSTLIVKEGVKYEALFQKNIPLIMGALHRAIRGKSDMTNKMDVYAYEYLMNGGRTGYSSIMELNRVQKRVERKIKKHGKENMFDVALEGLKTANEFAENITRLSVYVTSREVGKDIIQSISDAKEVTVNFNRGGSGRLGGNFFKNYYLFFNANIQALANHIKIWKGNPGRMAALTGAYALSGFIAPFLTALIGGDDGEEEYMKLSDWERQTSFCIYTGNGFIKIPIAHELRVYHTMGDLAYQWMMGYITSGEAAKKMTLTVSDLIPANPMGATEASWAELSPDLPKPLVQLITNTSFMGTRIYDKYKVEQDIPGFRMVRTNKKGEAFAPEFLIKLAEDTHYITGGDGTKGGLDFNPDKLNHIMRGYFGGLYTMASQAANITSKGISAIDTGEFKLKVRETPLKTFYASSDDLMERNSKLNAGYYDIKKESDQVRKWGKDYIKRAESGEISIDELYKKLNEINYYYYEGGSAVGINDFLKDINKMENMLKEVSPEEQKYLEMEINRYKKDLINFYQKGSKTSN